MGVEIKVRWVRRNRPVGALPFVTASGGLPQRQKVLVFLPHSDDGRFIGATLSLMNAKEGPAPRNDVKIVLVCPGYRSVEGDLARTEKSRLRWEEALRWGEVLGFSPEQLINFNAVKTYEARRCVPEDVRRMDALVEDEWPTMIFVPHVSDVAQHSNYNTRRLALHAVSRCLAGRCRDHGAGQDMLIVEYPTLHVPILPPADRNLIVVIDDLSLALTKHKANEAHQSQCSKLFDVMGRFIEAVDALSGADDVLQAMRGDLPTAKHFAGVCLNPRESRGEHFGITRLKVAPGAAGPVLVEERLEFPLSKPDDRRWRGGGDDT